MRCGVTDHRHETAPLTVAFNVMAPPPDVNAPGVAARAPAVGEFAACVTATDREVVDEPARAVTTNTNLRIDREFAGTRTESVLVPDEHA